MRIADLQAEPLELYRFRCRRNPEILICIVLMYRFATMAVTLFFWLPIDILSFINWTKHKDEEKKELTVVRKLTGWQEAAIWRGLRFGPL